MDTPDAVGHRPDVTRLRPLGTGERWRVRSWSLIRALRQALGQPVAFRSGGVLAYVFAVVAGVVTTTAAQPDQLGVSGILTLALLGSLYVLSGLYVGERIQDGAPVLLTAAYFATQLVLGLAIGVIGRFAGGYWLVLLPLAGQAVMLPRPWLATVCALILSIFVVPLGLRLGDWLLAAQYSLTYAAGISFVVVFSLILHREEHHRLKVERLAAELKEANARLRASAAQMEELATARERNRLAREIHDSIGHHLTVANVQIEAARAVLDSDRPRALEALDRAQALVREGLAEVRRSVAALRTTSVMDRPLPEALSGLVEESRAAGLPVALSVVGQPRALPQAAELTVYRAAQEGLTNIQKHAGAVSRVGVQLAYGSDGRTRLVVSDDGRGAGDEIEVGSGFGLIGIRERAALLGASVRVHTAPGEGCTLEVTLPA